MTWAARTGWSWSRRASGDDEIDPFLHAVVRAARAVRAGSLVAPRLHDVILLADAEVSWDLFQARTVTELRGGQCRVGVGGRHMAAGSRCPAGKPSWRCACRRRRAAPTG